MKGASLVALKLLITLLLLSINVINGRRRVKKRLLSSPYNFKDTQPPLDHSQVSNHPKIFWPSHQTRPYQRDQRDSGLKAQMVVKLLRATDSSTRFHCSGDFCLCFLNFCVFLKENLFSIVNFPNSPCVGTSGIEGTCYTASQCTSRVWPSLAFHHQQPWPLSVSIWKATFVHSKSVPALIFLSVQNLS